MSTKPSTQPQQSSAYEELRRAQQAIRAAERGVIVPLHEGKIESSNAHAPKPAARSKTMAPLDETAREAAVHRAVALMRTMTDYYGITVGELDDEAARLRKLTDERLMGAVRAYEHASRHAQVMLNEDKAREAAIERNAKTAAFYGKHGVTEEELAAQRLEGHPQQRKSTGRRELRGP